MAPLQGHTLGERQKHYNTLVKKTIVEKTAVLSKINYDDDDVDNMMKIDIACHARNVEYILDVFKCEDMLYVSRAINKSTWMITDPQYAHLINPKYLHSELFPQMNAKAVTKLMLHIRRHLKDEVRISAFYTYVNEHNPTASLHWLQNCSLEFIQTVIKERISEIPLKLFKRLLRRDFSILSNNMYNINRYHNYTMLNHILFLVKSNCDEFLNIVEGLYNLGHISFNANYTHFLMKTCPKRIVSNFGIYLNHIDLKTFAKFIKRDEIEFFLKDNWAMYVYYRGHTFDALSPFLVKMPRDRVIPLLTAVLFGDNSNGDSYNASNHSEKPSEQSDVQKVFYALEREKNIPVPLSFSVIYRWYQFVPFDIALSEMVTYIFAESSPELRNELLVVLLSCASTDMEHVKTVLQYYCDKHVNERYTFKNKFVNSLLAQHNAFRFNESTWNMVNTLFHSLEVYVESDNNVQMCLITIIVYKVLNDQPVPEIIEKKFEFETLKEIRNKLNKKEQDKLFDYLYNLLMTKLRKQSTDSESGMHDAIEMLKNIWNLITDWEKIETHHEVVVDKISELGNINKASPWFKAVRQIRKRRNRKFKDRRNLRNRRNRRGARKPHEPYINLPYVYKMVKRYRKKLFESSLLLNPSKEVCLNALKHDPELLARYKKEIDGLRCDDDVCLRTFLRKLRIFWPHSLAVEWAETNLQCIQNITGHRALVRGIIVLLPQRKLIDYIKSYTPEDNKVQWNDDNEIVLSLRKHIAKHMHLARPQLPAEVVLWYAKGDYLQYALLSLNTIYYNLRLNDIGKYINILLKAPVSLRKHGIRLVFEKFTTDEKINQLPIIWKSSRNASIRAITFTQTYDLLCNENEDKTTKRIWAVLSSFIDNLNDQEDKKIYKRLGKISKVPRSVVGECYQKSYLLLKSLPLKVDLANTIDVLIEYATEIIEYLDCDFVESSLLGSIYNLISNNNCIYMNILTCYLLHSKDSKIQMQKYNNLLHTVIEQCVPKWAVNEEQNINFGLQNLLQCICNGISKFVFEKKMVMPVEMLESIQEALVRGLLRKHDDYKVLARWRLSVAYIKLFEMLMKKSEEPNSNSKETDSDTEQNTNRDFTYEEICIKSTKDLANICIQQFTEDIANFCPSIYLIFEDVLYTVLNDFDIICTKMTAVFSNMLNGCENEFIYLLVLKILPKVKHIPQYYRNCFCHGNVLRKIYSYPSKEVNMHYFQAYNEKIVIETSKEPDDEAKTKCVVTYESSENMDADMSDDTSDASSDDTSDNKSDDSSDDTSDNKSDDGLHIRLID